MLSIINVPSLPVITGASFVPSSSRVIVTVARSMALPASSVTRPVTVLPVWAFAVYANSASIKAKKCFIV